MIVVTRGPPGHSRGERRGGGGGGGGALWRTRCLAQVRQRPAAPRAWEGPRPLFRPTFHPHQTRPCHPFAPGPLEECPVGILDTFPQHLPSPSPPPPWLRNGTLGGPVLAIAHRRRQPCTPRAAPAARQRPVARASRDPGALPRPPRAGEVSVGGNLRVRRDRSAVRPDSRGGRDLGAARCRLIHVPAGQPLPGRPGTASRGLLLPGNCRARCRYATWSAGDGGEIGTRAPNLRGRAGFAAGGPAVVITRASPPVGAFYPASPLSDR